MKLYRARPGYPEPASYFYFSTPLLKFQLRIPRLFKTLIFRFGNKKFLLKRKIGARETLHGRVRNSAKKASLGIAGLIAQSIPIIRGGV